MKISKVQITLFAVSIYLCALILTLPARQAYGWLIQSLPQSVRILRLDHISGSLWRGQAQQALIGGNHWQQLHWQYQPSKLLTGQLGLFIRAKKQQLSIAAELRQGLTDLGPDQTLTVNDLQLTSRLAEQPLASLIPLAANGQLSIHLDELVIKPSKQPLIVDRINGQVDITGLQLTLTNRPQLIGDISLTISTDANGRINCQWHDSGTGPLAVSGTMLIGKNGKYTLNSELKVRDMSQSGLLQTVRLLGTPGPDGRIRIARQGDLSRDLGWARAMLGS